MEARRTDVEVKLANFVKAISQGIFNASTAEAMSALETQKQELDAAIQAEHVKATLFEDEASIGAFYRRFAQATIDTPETRERLFEYFIDKVFVGRDQIVIASYYSTTAQRLLNSRTLKRRSPAATERGNCEPSLESESSTLPPQVEMGRIELPSDDAKPKTSPGAVCFALFSAPALTQTSC